jgi:hypothetical protein
MTSGLIISSIALGISLTVSAIKLIDWLVHADPRAIVHVGRWLLFFLAIGSIPCLIVLLFNQQTMGVRHDAWRRHADCADHTQLARDPLVAKVPTDLDRGQPV